MVSFVCESCNDTLKKPKLDQHAGRCRYAQFTCLDCNVTFQGTEYRSHTSCISEDQKYHKTVYKGPKQRGGQNNNQNSNPIPAPASPAPPAPTPAPTPSTSTVNENGKRAVEVDPTPADTTTAETSEPSSAKKAKKEKKKAEKAAQKAAEEAAAIAAAVVAEQEKAAREEDIVVQPDLENASLPTASEPEAVVVPVAAPAPPVPAPAAAVSPTPETTAEASAPALTVHAFLSTFLPDLLETSRPLSALKQKAVEAAKAAGWTDKSEVERAFMDGVWIGGNKPKKQLVLNFERTAATKVEKVGKSSKKREKA